MSVFEKVNNDIKKAMLEKDKLKLSALRAVKSAFLIEKTAKGGSGEIAEEAELKIIQKLIKQRRESAEIYKANNRPELYENEMAEATVIEHYLPRQLSDDEIKVSIMEIIRAAGASGMKDMGKVMGIATKKLAGQADGKTISNIVKELLS